MRSLRILATLVLPAWLAASALARDEFPADLFGGEVQVHDDGTVSFTYEFDRPEELRDWEGELAGGAGPATIKGGILDVRQEGKGYAWATLKAVFTGDDLSIEARCRVNAPRGKELMIRLYGPDNDMGYRLGMAYHIEGGVGSYFFKHGGGGVLKKVRKPDFKPGTWYDVRINVKGRSISVYVKHSLVLRVADDTFRQGRLQFGTFESHASFDSIRVRGTLDRDWLDALVAASETATDKGVMTVPGEEALLDAMAVPSRVQVRKGKKWFAYGNFDAAVREFEKAAGAEKKNPLPVFYLGRVRMAQERHSEAEELFARAASLQDDLSWIHVWRARSRRLNGDRADLAGALEDLGRALRADDADGEAYLELGLVHFLRKDLDASVASAQKALRVFGAKARDAEGAEAERLGNLGADAELQRDRFVWARDGIPLSPMRRASTPMGELCSDAPSGAVQATARWLSAVGAGFRMITGLVGPAGAKFYLVADRKVWDRYVFDGLSEEIEGVGRLVPPTGDILLNHAAPEARRMQAASVLALRLLARQNEAAPWVEEGLALYFEAIPSEGSDRLRAGISHPEAASRAKALLEGGSALPLPAFVRMDRSAFGRDREGNGALAWSVVHFLRHNPEGKRDFLSGYFRRLCEGKRGVDALGEMDWTALDSKWREHVRFMSD